MLLLLCVGYRKQPLPPLLRAKWPPAVRRLLWLDHFHCLHVPSSALSVEISHHFSIIFVFKHAEKYGENWSINLFISIFHLQNGEETYVKKHAGGIGSDAWDVQCKLNTTQSIWVREFADPQKGRFTIPQITGQFVVPAETSCDPYPMVKIWTPMFSLQIRLSSPKKNCQCSLSHLPHGFHMIVISSYFGAQF